MPCWAARIISGSAARRAASASCWLPEAMASSTLRTKVRMRERRERLIAVRLAILRVIFLAEAVLAMYVLVFLVGRCRRAGWAGNRSSRQVVWRWPRRSARESAAPRRSGFYSEGGAARQRAQRQIPIAGFGHGPGPGKRSAYPTVTILSADGSIAGPT